MRTEFDIFGIRKQTFKKLEIRLKLTQMFPASGCHTLFVILFYCASMNSPSAEMSYTDPFFNRILRLTHMISAQYPVTLSATAWTEGVGVGDGGVPRLCGHM